MIFILLLVNPLMHRHFATIHENHPFVTQTNGTQIHTGANIGNQCFERIKKSGNFWSKELEVKQKKTSSNAVNKALFACSFSPLISTLL